MDCATSLGVFDFLDYTLHERARLSGCRVMGRKSLTAPSAEKAFDGYGR
jgi:hypothetical protein